MLAPGQRLVSRDGALWRWDGFTAGADAPTAAAQRLAQKNRLAELDAEAVARDAQAARAPRRHLPAAEAALRQAASRKRARQARREAQHRLDEARDALAEAEKAAGELSSRRAALDEARARVVEGHAEAAAAFDAAEHAVARDAPDLGELQSAARTRQRPTSPRDRATLADARAAHEGLRRETEARSRRLAAIDGERRNWTARAENADRQIAALGERRAEAEREQQALVDAPDEIEARRRALLSQLAEAESACARPPRTGCRRPRTGRPSSTRRRRPPSSAVPKRAKPASAPRSG